MCPVSGADCAAAGMLFDVYHCILCRRAAALRVGTSLVSTCLGCPRGTFSAQTGLLSAAACSGIAVRASTARRLPLLPIRNACSAAKGALATALLAERRTMIVLDAAALAGGARSPDSSRTHSAREPAPLENSTPPELRARRAPPLPIASASAVQGGTAAARRACTPTRNAHSAPQVGSATRRDFPPSATAAAAVAGTETSPKDSQRTRSATNALEGASRQGKAVQGRNVQHCAPSADFRTLTVRVALMNATRAGAASSRSKALPHAQTAPVTPSLRLITGSANPRSPPTADLAKLRSTLRGARIAPRGVSLRAPPLATNA